MTRSRRKQPICGITKAKSEKQDKRRACRVLRRENKVRLRAGNELMTVREASDIWDMAKDGKRPFDPEAFPEGMRK